VPDIVVEIDIVSVVYIGDAQPSSPSAAYVGMSMLGLLCCAVVLLCCCVP
jgi:hypothetical protein